MKNQAAHLRRNGLRALVKLAILSFGNASVSGQEILVASGSSWHYSDAGPIAEASWRNPLYDDAAWNSGPAQLGYGDGDEVTVVGYGPDSGDKFITTYFRHSFVVANPARLGRLEGRLLRDDGAVVYLNVAMLRGEVCLRLISCRPIFTRRAAPSVRNTTFAGT